MSRKWMLVLFCGVVGLGSTVALRISLSNDRRLDAALSELAARAEDNVSAREEDEFSAREEESVRSRGRAPQQRQPQDRQPPALKDRQPPTLRQRFVELATERAKRMSDDELGEAVEQITKQIADQDTAAEMELEKALDQLKLVAEKFSGTPSAERANRALEAITARPSRDARAPRNVPEYRSPADAEDADDAFERVDR